MRLLFIGDVVGDGGCDAVYRKLTGIIGHYGIDFVIANGENACSHNGINSDKAEALRYAGVDVITGGNHSFRQKSVYSLMNECDYLIRPYNLPRSAEGNGYTEVKTPFGRIGVLNLMGQAYIEGADNPFDAADRALERLSGCDYIFVDFHAESTGEKKALGFYLDGRVSGVFGTHTHVQTSDCRFLPKGTAYITDVGMTGGSDSVLGIKKELAIERFRTGMPVQFEQDNDGTVINTVVADFSSKEIFTLNI